MSKLIVLVGPPGSGKSTLAKEYISKGYVDISQDRQGKAHLDNFMAALEAGRDVIVDRMGFSREQRNRYIFPASGRGYETEIIVLHQPYRVCLERVRARTDHETIKDEKAARSALGTFFGKYERPEQGEASKITFVYPEGEKPSAIVCDLDGTLCNVDHRLHFVRPPKEWEEEIALAKQERRKNIHGWRPDWAGFFDNILGDSVNQWCADILRLMSSDKHTIVYCSGRPDDRKRDTVEWLKNNALYSMHAYHDFYLYMRPRNDSRDDSIVKEVILDFEILTRFRPYFMVDDRQRVVDMWRKRGYTCLQCAHGDF
ncbi:unnamed protein product [Sphagnum balticum]